MRNYTDLIAVDNLRMRYANDIPMIEKNVELEHWETEHTMNYHRKQFIEPKRSTVAFEKFLTRCRNIDNSNILDLACGGGGGSIPY